LSEDKFLEVKRKVLALYPGMVAEWHHYSAVVAIETDDRLGQDDVVLIEGILSAGRNTDIRTDHKVTTTSIVCNSPFRALRPKSRYGNKRGLARSLRF
jgi:hypothetical protein